MRAEPDRITVLFEANGYKTLSLEAIQRDALLTLAAAKARKKPQVSQ
jgi:ATP-dependent DNA helicase RecQ